MGKTVMVAGEVCLYGTYAVGYGFLAVGPKKLEGGKLVASGEKMFGDGSPSPSWGATEAMWMGLEALKTAGMPNGSKVAIFMPGGEKRAVTEVGSCKAFGDLKWEPAPVYTLSLKEVRTLSEEVRR